MAIQAEEITIALGEAGDLKMVMRPGTKDAFTIEEIWTKHPYKLSRYGDIAHRTFIDDAYTAILTSGRRPLILDLGANIGASVLAFRRYYPEAAIVAVEPEPENFALLKRNVSGEPWVTCIQAAVAPVDGEVLLGDPGRSTDAYRTGALASGSASLGTVKALSVPSLLKMTGGVPMLAKIDIEGAEMELFSAATEWVDLFPAIAIELHDWMLPGKASSAPFMRTVGALSRDFINPGGTDVFFSLRNLPRG